MRFKDWVMINLKILFLIIVSIWWVGLCFITGAVFAVSDGTVMSFLLFSGMYFLCIVGYNVLVRETFVSWVKPIFHKNKNDGNKENNNVYRR